MTTKTFRQIREFNGASEAFLRANATNIQTKLGYAIKKITSDSIAKVLQEYNAVRVKAYYKDVETVRIDNALTDPLTKAILLAPKEADRDFTYDKEGLKAVLEAEQKWNTETSHTILEEWDAKEFDIEPYYASELPEEAMDLEPFYGFVIEQK